MKTDRKGGTSLEHTIGPRGRFTLRQSSGEIVVRGVEGEVVRVRSMDDRDLAELFEIDTTDDALALRQFERSGLAMFSRREGAELAIDVPHGATVTIEAQSADISASDLSGNKRFWTASGEVSLTRFAGQLDVETVSGEIEIDGQAPLDLLAKSVSGDVDVRVPVVRKLDLGTTSGDIRLDAELSGEGPFAMRTISGDVIVVGRSGFRVEAESITGDLSSDLPSKRESMPGRAVLTVGRPGPTLSFRSVSGDFHVAQPRQAAPERVDPPAAEPAPRAGADEPTAAESRADAESAPTATTDDTRLEILRALERGDISVAEATDRLSQLDEVLR